jgi:hypothetical protein
VAALPATAGQLTITALSRPKKEITVKLKTTSHFLEIGLAIVAAVTNIAYAQTQTVRNRLSADR